MASDRVERSDPTGEPSQPGFKKRTTTTTTVYTTKTLTSSESQDGNKTEQTRVGGNRGDIATVESLGKRAAMNTRTSLQQKTNTDSEQRGMPEIKVSSAPDSGTVGAVDESIEGNRLVTTISTVAAQTGQSRIVLALLKDGEKLQIKVQEMKPGIFEVGANYKDCLSFFEEHQKLVRNLRKRSNAPIESWMNKYRKICETKEKNMSAERKLVYMCMAENLQGCWRALLSQLDTRSRLLGETCGFYEMCEELVHLLNRAENHVQVFRQEFLEGPNSARFNAAYDELRSLNEKIFERHSLALVRQSKLLDLIRTIGTGNLGDSRVNLIVDDAQSLITYIENYLIPLERRKISLDSVAVSSRTVKTNAIDSSWKSKEIATDNYIDQYNKRQTSRTGIIREISNFNDLSLADNWLEIKVEQLNSSLLSSLGINVSDSRTILQKHEQIALECRAIEEATLTFNGRNIHAIKSVDKKDDKNQGDESLFERQKSLANRVRDVITILEARIVLLRRSIDFYLHSKEATTDIGKMMRRLQVDNSLQSVQFVSNQLELKDVSSVVASGATIISELQQLQLAQQSGQRSRIVSLNLVTSGIRAIIDQLNQDLAHLKTVLNQRKLVLLNEDATKLASNFLNKCRQLQFWLDGQVKSFLATNNLVGLDSDRVKSFIADYEQIRVSLQNKTLEVEALLRSLPSFTENFDAKSKIVDEIQVASDELRQDWISVTNCLDRRIDLARKYSAILGTVSSLARELELLHGGTGRPTTPERTDEDIRANVNQSLLQLENQVKNFSQDVEKTETSLKQAGWSATGGLESTSDINKEQLVEVARKQLDQVEDRKSTLFRRLDAGRSANSRNQEPPARERPQQVDPPRFTRVLADKTVEPFGSIELECETDDPFCRVEWFTSNFRRIPSNISHSITSEATLHKLTINNFSPTCCGTYIARASNNSGQAVSQCKLLLSGIREHQDDDKMCQTRTSARALEAEGLDSSRRADTATSSFSGKQPNSEIRLDGSNISRIIRGVDSRQTTETITTCDEAQQFPVTQATYKPADEPKQATDGSFGANLQVNYIESPISSSAQSRQVSESPFEGTPQPPVFVQGLADSMAHCCSRAGLVCLVVGNPPPSIEWLHNNKTIATTKCARSNTCPRASLCKLIIETVDERTKGQYVCRASNRIGASSTGITLAK